ncbi:MAG: VWA domain-containing protein [Nannocystaceae bacterium]
MLSLAGCSGGNEETDSESQGSMTTINVTITTSGTATDGSSSTTDSTTDSATSMSSESDSTTNTTGNECVGDGDCDDGYVCMEGSCEFDPSDCGEAVIEIPITTPNVVLVLDKSGSMVANSWDGDADPNTPDVTRWFSLYNVVDFIATQFNNSMNLGMVLYPSKKAKSEYTINACLVEATPDVPTAPTNGPTILASMPPATATSSDIAGGTPARAGMITAIDHLSGIQDGLPQFMILVTDGAANCSLEAADEAERFEVYDEALAQTIADAASNGIPTFVVGIDIKDEVSVTMQDGNPDATNTFQKLNELAVAGGVPKNDPNEQFYNSQNQIELQDALTAIAQQVLPCVIDLNPVPAYPDFVEVSVNGVDYGKMQVDDCNTEDGWQFVDDTFMQIQLCGQACTDFQGSGNLDAQYKCPGSG